MLKSRRMRVAAALVVFVAGAAIAFAAGGGVSAISQYTTDEENAPEIVRTNPAAACDGDVVAIIGENFDGTEAVDFNGTDAQYKVISDSQIRAIAPAGFTKGPIHVTTPLGTATSPKDFKIKCKTKH
jgi:hypothetical protein